jgi:hypothetical protein
MARCWRKVPWQAATARAAHSWDRAMVALHLRLGADGGSMVVAVFAVCWILNNVIFFSAPYLILAFVFGLLNIRLF